MFEILACAIGRAKKFAVSESHGIARVAYLGQIMITKSGRTPKFSKERTREGRDISVRDKPLRKGCHLRIARNHTGSIFRPNNDDWKRSQAKF